MKIIINIFFGVGEEKDLVKDASFLRSASVPAVINKIGENIRVS